MVHESSVQSARDRVDQAFEAWGRLVARRAWIAIAVCAALGLALTVQLPRLSVDASSESFLHADDPVRITNDFFEHQFGRKGQVLIALEPDEVFAFEFLETLRSLHGELEAVPQVAKVTSLVNARHTFGRDDELVVEDLLETWPEAKADLAELERRVFANPLYMNHLIDREGRLTTITVELDSYSALAGAGEPMDELAGFDTACEDTCAPITPRKERTDDLAGFDTAAGDSGEAAFLTSEEEIAAVARVREVLARYQGPDLRIYLTGAAAYHQAFRSIMMRDVVAYVVLSGVLIAVMLLVLLRRIAGVVLPMLIFTLALFCDAGTMALVGVPITLPMQILPTFLLAVATCSAVHILVIFYRTWTNGCSRADAIATTLGHSGLPVVMACLTTAGGLLSFISSDLAPVGHFGMFGPIGVIYALFFTLVLLPALLAVVPMRPSPPRKREEGRPLLDRTLLAFGFTATRYPWVVLGSSLALALVCGWGASRLYFSHDPISWLPADQEFRQATEFINERLQGSITLDALLETNQENGLYDPELMGRIARLHAEAEGLEQGELRVGKVVSVADIVRETHQALNENDPEFYRIPEDRELVAQELLLFENSGSDDLEALVDPQFSMANVTLKLPWVDGVQMNAFIDLVEERFAAVIGDEAKLTLTGGTVVFARTFDAVIRSMAQSYVLALMIITPLMILLVGSLRGGLISLVPNLFPILMTLGLMGWLGYPIDFATVMMGAIVLGVAVDDTIHVLHVFQRYFSRSEDARRAIRETLLTSGRAVTFTSIVLAVGFGSFALSAMSNMVALGFFVSFAVMVALFADLLITPALLVLTRGTRKKGTRTASSVGTSAAPAGGANSGLPLHTKH